MKISFLLFFAVMLVGFSAKSQCEPQFGYTAIACDSLYFSPDTVNPQALYSWSFGDGTTSTDPAPVHHYSTNGTYNVSLLVYDSLNNCADDYMVSVTVLCDTVPTVDPCDAIFDFDFVTCDSVWFMPAGYEPSAIYSWNFADGTVFYGAPIMHHFANNGTFAVTMMIEDTLHNCVNISNLNVVVACDSTLIDTCNAAFDLNFTTCDSVWFYTADYNPNALYTWNFGDGQFANGGNTAHQFTAEGTYNVSLVVYDSLSNCVDDYIVSVTIACDSIPTVDPCNAQFDFDFATCDSVWFYPAAYNPNAYYSWNFGDGQFANGANTAHQFTAEGTYFVSLLVYDSLNNCADDYIVSVTIACDSIPPVDSCSADFDFDFVTCDSVWFMPSVYEPSALYSWNFGDGSTAYEAPIAHYYANDGTYAVTLLIEDTLHNCVDFATYYVTVACDSIPVDTCNANFDFDFATCDSVWFAPSVYQPSAYYEWNFGDGSPVSYSPYTAHTYANNGTYTVTLLLEDPINGCWQVVTHVVDIFCDSIPTIDTCNADFNFDFVACDSVWFSPLVYQSGAYYEWNFGDGSAVSYDPNAMHTYANNGTYLVTLLVEDPMNNCWQVVTHVVDIYCDLFPPLDSCNADFDFDFVTCDSVAFAPSVYQSTAFYVWNFGEGASDNNPFTAHQYTHDGTFVVTLTVIDCSNNCSASYTTTLDVDCDSTLGIQPVTDGKPLNVYPNPGTGIFYVELASENATIQVYDLSGNIVVNTSCTEACNNFALDLSNLANGAYSVVVIANGEMQSTRIIKS